MWHRNRSVHLPDRGDAGKAPATLASWQVDDIETTVKELRYGGVVFEVYDFPGLMTDDGVAALPGGQSGNLVRGPGRQHPQRLRTGLIAPTAAPPGA